MKILPLNFSKSQRVNILRDIDESELITETLNRLYPVQSMLESYAKQNNVDIFVATVVPDSKQGLSLVDNVFSLSVKDHNNSSSKSASFVVHRGNDIYKAQKSGEYVSVNDNGDVVKFKTTHNFEDNFLRSFFRTVENLVKQVKGQD